MTILSPTLLLWWTPFLMASGCLPVPGDRILARDVAPALPVFARLDPETVLGWAPAPGLERGVEAAELTRWLRRHNLAVDPVEPARLCLTRNLVPLDRNEIVAAVRKAVPEWTVELLDWPRSAFPAGDLKFDARAVPRPTRPHPTRPAQSPPAASASGASQPVTSIAPDLWRGVIVTPHGRRYPIWARVRLSVTRTIVRVVEPIGAGQPIGAAQLALVPVPEHPLWPVPLADLSAAQGQRARRTLPAGAALMAADLAPLPTVRRGDEITIEAGAGSTRLQFQARAEGDARAGQTVLLKNPFNGRRFPARVTAPGRATPLSQP